MYDIPLHYNALTELAFMDNILSISITASVYYPRILRLSANNNKKFI